MKKLWNDKILSDDDLDKLLSLGLIRLLIRCFLVQIGETRGLIWFIDITVGRLGKFHPDLTEKDIWKEWKSTMID